MKRSTKKFLAAIGDISIGTGYLLQSNPTVEDLKDLEETLKDCSKSVRRIRKLEQLRQGK